MSVLNSNYVQGALRKTESTQLTIRIGKHWRRNDHERTRESHSITLYYDEIKRYKNELCLCIILTIPKIPIQYYAG